MKMSQTLKKIKQIASKLNKPGESTSSRPGWMVRDSHLTHGGLRMTNTTAGTFTELKETSPQRVLSPLFPHSRQARMGSPKWRHPLMLIASLFLLSFPFFLATPTHAADSITVSISGNPTVTVAPTSEGTFADSGNINIGVTSTAASGYTLAIAGGGNTSLTGKTDSTKSITSISSAIDQNTFNTNTSYNNKWGYKPSMHYNTSTEQRASNSNYLPSPTSNADIIDITSDNSSNNYTMSIGARVTSDLGFQTYENNTFVITAVGNSHVLDCDPTKLCVEYEGNGLTYDGETLNRVNYNSTTTRQSQTKYAHMSNVGDDGIATGDLSTISTNTTIDDTQSVTIDGADTMAVTLYYDTHNNSYGYVSVYQNPFNISNVNDSSVSTATGNLSGRKYGYRSGRNTNYTTWNSVTYAVSGDTVKFHFYRSNTSTSYRYYYGYYAIITGTSIVHNRSVSSGEYATPTGTNAIFHGWSTTQATPGGGLPSQVEYANESDILTKMPGDEGETKTLYAVWQQEQQITFTKDNNVSSIAVLNSDGTTAGTITTSGQSLTLLQGNTYTIKPTYSTRYAPNAFEKTSGVGTLTGDSGYGKTFQVGAGSATINVTSQYVNIAMQNLSSSSCTTNGTWVYDNRDNEVYLIGKLADNKCWMLDNLRLDITDSTILNGLTTSNTHVDSASLTSLKSGNRSAGAQYASSGFATWNSSSKSNVYNQAKANADYKDTTTTSYGVGSGKIGVYYNYCAASAGSYCYDSGTPSSDPDTSTLQDAKYDLCPAGWRMPTGSSSGEYQALYATYSSASEGQAVAFRIALSTPLSGTFLSGSASGQAVSGVFWSSTSNNGNDMYYLNVSSSKVYPSNSYTRNNGYSLRCLLSS